MPDDYMCEDKFIVYSFVCNFCNKKYIGQTCRQFQARYREHEYSLRMNNNNSALSDHSKNDHNNSLTINDFQVEILTHCNTPVETRIAEAQMIDIHRPDLNRKYEITRW